MKADEATIRQRIHNMKNIYLKIGEYIDNFPITDKNKDFLKDKILGDEELRRFIEEVESNRPPRLFLIGRTGVGKSCFINALTGAYVAKVSDTRSCTGGAERHQFKLKDETLFDIFDSRGIEESEALSSDTSAEKMLLNQIIHFSPDAVIMMLNSTHRDDITTDVQFMKKVAEDYKATNKMRLPIVVAVNKCDEVPPARIKVTNEYTINKVETINKVVQYYKEIITRNGLEIDAILPISSLIDWMTPDGEEVSVEDINKLPKHYADNLQIAFDGRYNRDKLIEILENSIQDSKAKMGLRMSCRLNTVVKKMAVRLNVLFSGISAAVAGLGIIPISDIIPLIVIQAMLVMMIASLSGREFSLNTVVEFICSLGGIGVAGYGFRLAAQQLSKLLAPGAGSVVSGTIASTGTSAIGVAAIAYYIDGNSKEEAQKKFKETKNKKS